MWHVTSDHQWLVWEPPPSTSPVLLTIRCNLKSAHLKLWQVTRLERTEPSHRCTIYWMSIRHVKWTVFSETPLKNFIAVFWRTWVVLLAPFLLSPLLLLSFNSEVRLLVTLQSSCTSTPSTLSSSLSYVITLKKLRHCTVCSGWWSSEMRIHDIIGESTPIIRYLKFQTFTSSR